MMMPSTQSAAVTPFVERRERNVLRSMMEEYVFANPTYASRATLIRPAIARLMHTYADNGFQLRLMRILSTAAEDGRLYRAIAYFARDHSDHLPYAVMEQRFTDWRRRDS